MRDAPCRVCHICGASGSLLHEGVQDRLFGVAGQWNFRKCDNAACGLVWLDPMPLECDLHDAYATYYTHGDSGLESGAASSRGLPRLIGETLQQLWLGALFLKSARKQIEGMFLDGIAPGRSLEVGCGDGRLLAKMQDRGWVVEGQDVDAQAVEQARRISGAQVYLGSLSDLALPAETYDVIVMNHVLEHVYDPTALVGDCRRLLKPGGLLVATTPNPDSFGHARFGRAWRGLEPPRHLHLLPPPALSKIASVAGYKEWRAWTTPARAGGMLAASLDIKRSEQGRTRSWDKALQLAATAWYQASARLAHVWDRNSGEESVLQARR